MVDLDVLMCLLCDEHALRRSGGYYHAPGQAASADYLSPEVVTTPRGRGDNQHGDLRAHTDGQAYVELQAAPITLEIFDTIERALRWLGVTDEEAGDGAVP
jgi:hypothetical protein